MVQHAKQDYVPLTIREAGIRIHSWADFRVEFYNWLDDFYTYPTERVRLIQEEPEPLFDERAGAFIAASVHHLCLKYDLTVPKWVGGRQYRLAVPWFHPPEINIRPIQFVESPGAFRSRNIFVFSNVLDRM